jgi:protein-S-isoprenylcysteine O-methyltransferase Ste14
MTQLNFFTVCWWVFIIVWVSTALSVKPTRERQDWGGRLFTCAFLTVMSLLLTGMIQWQGIDTRLWSFGTVLRYIAYVLMLSGLVIAIWARFVLGTNWSATVTFREGHELIERGPYRLVRHPIYTGFLFMVGGTALALGNLAGILALVICFLGHWWKLRREEALLTKHFPTYPEYKLRTKALIPFIF